MVKRDFIRVGIDTATEPLIVVGRGGRRLGLWVPGDVDEGTVIGYATGGTKAVYTTSSPTVRLKPTMKDPDWLKGGR